MALVLALLCAAALASPRNTLDAAPPTVCRQNGGRACTDYERRHPYLLPSLRHTQLTTLANSTDLVQLAGFLEEFKAAGDWVFINPAVLVYRGATWVFTRCFSNRYWRPPPAKCPDDSLYATRDCPPISIANFNFVCYGKVNKQLQMVSELKALPCQTHYDAFVAAPKSEGQYAYFGVEDPRAFMWGDDVYVAVNGPLPPDRIKAGDAYIGRRMYIQRVFPAPAHDRLPLTVADDDSIQLKSYEKNWTPIGEVHNAVTNSSDYLFARFVEPHQILQCNRKAECSVAASRSNKAYFDELKKRHSYNAFHLGTNAVRINDSHYLALFHGLKRMPEHDNAPYYGDHFYVFESASPWSIVRVSRSPLRIEPSPGFQFSFTNGLAYVDGRLAISYGVNDLEAWVQVITLEQALHDMDALPGE